MAGMTEEEVKQVQKTMKELQSQIAERAQESSSLKKELETSKEALATAHKELAGSKQQIDAAKNELKQAQDRATEMQKQLQAANATVQELEKKLGEATAKKPVGMVVGASTWVRQAGGLPLNRRDAPGLGSHVLDSFPIGTEVTLLEGPRPADGFHWWRVRAADGREGWVAGEDLVTQPEA
jgi:hypothetical protein